LNKYYIGKSNVNMGEYKIYKSVLAVVAILVLVVLVSGCTSPDVNNSTNTKQSTGPYSVDNSTFQMPEGWIQVDSGVTDAIEFKRGDDTHIRIEELTKPEYDSNYADVSKQRSNSNVTEETKNMSGVEVRIVRTTDNTNGNINDYYFFVKDGKYYQITAWDNTGNAGVRNDIDNAVNTIISTLGSVTQDSQANSGNNTDGTNTDQTNDNSNDNGNGNVNGNGNGNTNPGDNHNHDGGGDQTCPTCGGAGVVPVNPNDPNTSWKGCPTCGGDGLI
jgi:hypothetical protein